MEHRRNNGFTLIEIMIAISIFVLVTTGIISTYIMCQKSWHNTSLHMLVSQKTTISMLKIICGIGTNSGLRECRNFNLKTNVNGNWRLEFENFYNKTNWIDYNRESSNLVFWETPNNPLSKTKISDNVKCAHIIPTNKNINIAIAIQQSSGLFMHAITNTTTIRLRN